MIFFRSTVRNALRNRIELLGEEAYYSFSGEQSADYLAQAYGVASIAFYLLGKKEYEYLRGKILDSKDRAYIRLKQIKDNEDEHRKS